MPRRPALLAALLALLMLLPGTATPWPADKLSGQILIDLSSHCDGNDDDQGAKLPADEIRCFNGLTRHLCLAGDLPQTLTATYHRKSIRAPPLQG